MLREKHLISVPSTLLRAYVTGYFAEVEDPSDASTTSLTANVADKPRFGHRAYFEQMLVTQKSMRLEAAQHAVVIIGPQA